MDDLLELGVRSWWRDQHCLCLSLTWVEKVIEAAAAGLEITVATDLAIADRGLAGDKIVAIEGDR